MMLTCDIITCENPAELYVIDKYWLVKQGQCGIFPICSQHSIMYHKWDFLDNYLEWDNYLVKNGYLIAS